MGKGSKIEWTHHTFNPWWGCEKVSDGCKNCYAETWAKRTCGHCTHPGNPLNQEDDEFWEEVPDEQPKNFLSPNEDE